MNMKKRISLPAILVFIVTFLFLSPASAQEIRVTGIRLDQSTLILPLGEPELITATVYPANAGNRDVYWVISDRSVIEVIDLGHSAQIRALSPGRATVTAVTVDGEFRASCVVEAIVLVRTLSMTPESATLTVNEQYQFQVAVEPRDATDQRLIWESTDPAVASVSESGLVTALNPGEARIVARSVQEQTITAYSTIIVSGAAAQPVGPVDGEEEPVIVPPVTDSGGINIFLWGAVAAAVAIAVLLAVLLTVKRRGRTAPPPAAASAPVAEASPVTGTRAAPQAGATRAVPKQYRPVLKGISGYFAGQTLELAEGRLAIGRDPRLAQLVYPPDREEISRKHCTVRFDQRTKLFVLEDSSSNGTFLHSGARLDPEKPYSLGPGERFYLAGEGELFAVDLEQ